MKSLRSRLRGTINPAVIGGFRYRSRHIIANPSTHQAAHRHAYEHLPGDASRE
jgi:hypothetical protein